MAELPRHRREEAGGHRRDDRQEAVDQRRGNRLRVARAERDEGAREPELDQVSAARSQPYYLDVTHPMANKGTVVTTLSKLLSIPIAEIATIGDMPNDVLMFRKSGMSIAMGNASAEVQKQARFVTASYNDEGFAKAVENFVLGAGAEAQAPGRVGLGSDRLPGPDRKRDSLCGEPGLRIAKAFDEDLVVVFAKFWPGAADVPRRARQPADDILHPQWPAEFGVIDCDDVLARNDVLVVEECGNAVHRSHRRIKASEPLGHVGIIKARGRGFEFALERQYVRQPRAIVFEAGVRDQMRDLERGADALEGRLRAAGNRNPASVPGAVGIRAGP